MAVHMTQAVDMDQAHRLYEKLLGVLRPRKRVLTAFSGGVDSTLVAYAARQALGKADAPAAIGDSASLPRHELEHARRLARRLDLDLIETPVDEQDDPNYQRNAGDRCYFCKTHLYARLHELASRLNVPYIASGANLDDLGDHRPGLQAAREAQVIQPLWEAGLDKASVRAVAALLGLPNADKPASPCLASRIPHGTPVTLERLRQIEQAENTLRELGFAGFRVRHHEQVARVELPWDQVSRLMEDDALRRQVIQGIKQAGYLFVTLDLEGFRSGSGNVLLTVKGRLEPGPAAVEAHAPAGRTVAARLGE